MKLTAILTTFILLTLLISNIGHADNSLTPRGFKNLSTLNLLTDTFDDENEGVPELDYADFSNWNVSDGSFDLIGNGFFDFFPQNGLYVDLDGSIENPGVLRSNESFTLERGIYYLQFDLAGSQRGDTNTVTVRLGDVFNEQFTLDSSEPFINISRTIIVTTPTAGRLSFELTAGGGDNVGLILDNVDLNADIFTETLYLPLIVR